MKTLPMEQLRALIQIIAHMDSEYENWRPYHRELAEFILPMRYRWLEQNNVTGGVVTSAITTRSFRNPKILDSVGTKAARDLAAGMLNGIASPAREWFKIRITGFESDTDVMLSRWREEVLRRMFLILADSNFYNSFAIQLLDLAVFGTAGMLVYEDFEDVIRFYNLPVGEFRIAQDHRRDVNTISRCYTATVEQLVTKYGLENCLPTTQQKYKTGKAELQHGIRVAHIIEPNREDGRYIPGGYPFREFYFEIGVSNAKSQILSSAIYHERPGAFPRWEISGNEPYGLSPGMDALGDIIQLQHETIRKAEAIDKMTDPPLAIDASLRNQPGSSQAGGRFYIPSYSTAGARPVHQTSLPLGELSQDIRDVQQRIRDAFFNDLFRMISQLQTVRSATEIDARREEKLILMGAILERIDNEALDPIMQRLFGIMKRKGLIPPLPAGYEKIDVQVEYVSILSDAQRAAGTGVIERFMQVVGNTIAVDPSVKHVIDWHEILRDYGARLSVPAAGINPREIADQLKEQEAQQLQQQQAAQTGLALSQAGKNLSDIQVGGGQSAVESLLGGL